MSNLLIFIGVFVAILFYLFLFWRRLKEDYTSSEIFSSAFYILFGLFLGYLIVTFIISPNMSKSAVFLPIGLWFWGCFVGSSAGLFLAYKRFELKFLEVLEAAAVGLLGAFSVFLCYSAITFELVSIWLYLLVCVLSLFLFYFVNRKYRSFSWYKSGKVGFSGLFLLGMFFLIRASVALFYPPMISFIGKFDAIVSASLSFAFFLSLYNLSETT